MLESAATDAQGDALDIGHIRDWLIAEGSRHSPPQEVIQGLCEKLNEIGVPISRGMMAARTLHPIYGAFSFNWTSATDTVETNSYARDPTGDSSPEWDSSPFAYMTQTGQLQMRVRMDDPDNKFDFPIFEKFIANGAVDYLALLHIFDPDGVLELSNGIVTSWLTNHPDGFSDEHVAAIKSLLPTFGLVVRMAGIYFVANTLMETYLGREQGQRVLSGEIDRGTVETINAGIMCADLRGFTSLTDAVDGDTMIALLNEYMESMAEPVIERGGEILKYLGDGFIAVVDLGKMEHGAICETMLGAANEALDRVAEINKNHQLLGKPTMELDIALHQGEVRYGNIGTPKRLDFTVIGPAVNEAVRIESLCGELDQNLLLSKTFAEAAESCSHTMISLGKHRLKGVAEPQEIFAISDRCGC